MDQSVQEFVERMGLLAEGDGFPRIAGRILGLLLVEEEKSSLDDMVEKLQVSKGSISTNVRLLERLAIIERVSSPGDRKDYYRLGDEPWEQLFAVARDRLEKVHSVTETGIRILPEDRKVARQRLEAWSEFYSFLLDDLASKLERWRSRRPRGTHGRRPPEANGG